jgi:hypothetical protein
VEKEDEVVQLKETDDEYADDYEKEESEVKKPDQKN